MIYLLMIIQLVIGPNDAFVQRADVVKLFHSESQCKKEIKRILSDKNNPPPKTINFGCVPLKGKLI